MAVLRLSRLPLIEVTQPPLGLGARPSIPASGGTPLGFSVPTGTTGAVIQAPVDISWSISTSPGSVNSTFFTLTAGQPLVLSTVTAVNAFRAVSRTGQSVQLLVQFTQGGGSTGTGSDTTPPAIQSRAYAAITEPQETYLFSVVFTDAVNISYSSFDVSKISVVGPLGFNKIPTFVNISPAADAKTVTVNLSVIGPFSNTTGGVYSISVGAGAIFDTSANQNQTAIAGTFVVAIPEFFALGAAPNNLIGINGAVTQVF